jgi:hypothetical protein
MHDIREQNSPDIAGASVVDKKLLAHLESGTPGQRRAAERALDELGPQGLEQLLCLIASENRKRQRRARLFTTVWVLALVVTVPVILWQWRTTGHIPRGSSIVFNLGSCVGALTAFSSMHRRATYALARYDDLRAVGPFASMVRASTGEIRASIEKGLIRLLPRMQASDAHLLNESQRSELSLVLGQWPVNQDLVKAILLAWQQVGDEKAIPVVESLAHNDKRPPELRRAAEHCLPYLRQSAADLKSAQTLLRASDAGGSNPEELLRAASDETTVNPGELLRADTADRTSPDLSSYNVAPKHESVEAHTV